MSEHYDGRRCFPVKTKISSRQFLAFDTEDDTKGNTVLVVFHDGKQSWVFHHVTAALQFLYNISTEKSLILVAHNLEYDLVNLFRNRLTALSWLYFGGKLISARVSGTKLLCWDSLHHSYHMPLSMLGKMVGMPKKDSNYGWTKGKALTKTDLRYAVRDALICHTFMERMQEHYERIGCRMRTTCPATAMDYWRRHHLPDAIPGVTDKVRTYFRKAYFGGRVEIFRMGKHTMKGIRYYDVNSLYPTVMQGQYPDIADLSSNGEHGVRTVTVEVPYQHVPPLPWRGPEGKLLFPVGRFRGSWCTNELDYAVKECGVKILKEHSRLGCNSLCRPFATFVETCYAERLGSKSELESILWKFMLNGLYGKFGTSGTLQTLVHPNRIPKGTTATGVFLGPLAFVEHETEPPPYANVLWSAWTTAAARIYLHRALRRINREGMLIYCDTDSIIAAVSRRNVLPIGRNLGQWKIEAECTLFEAIAPKVYRYTERNRKHYKAKGVPKDYADFIFHTGATKFSAPVRLRESFARNKQANVWIIKKKTLQSEYMKRIVCRDGTTRPLSLP